MKLQRKCLSKGDKKSNNENVLFFIALNLADYCTTACIILQGGVEVMPIAAGFIEWYGLMGLFFHKLIIASGIGYLIRNQSDKFWTVINWCLAVIITWNSTQIFIELLNQHYTN